MLDLMAVGEGGMPLYLHVVIRILRDMRVNQQKTGSGFNYSIFKEHLEVADLTPAQRGPLNQRLDTLESFMTHGKTAEDSTIDWQAKVCILVASCRSSLVLY